MSRSYNSKRGTKSKITPPRCTCYACLMDKKAIKSKKRNKCNEIKVLI